MAPVEHPQRPRGRRPMARRRTAAIAAGAALAVASLVGCGPERGGGDADPARSAERPARDALTQHLRTLRDFVDVVTPARTLAQAVPTYRWRAKDGRVFRLADALVVGRVTRVRADAGYITVGEDAAGGSEVEFDDPRAEWRTMTVTVRPSFAPRPSFADASTTFVMSVADRAQLRGFAREFRHWGTVVAFLDHSRGSLRVYDADMALGRVRDGRLTFPAYRRLRGMPSDAGALHTLRDLVRAVDEAPGEPQPAPPGTF